MGPTTVPQSMGLQGFLLEIFIAARYLRGQTRTAIFTRGGRFSIMFLSLMVFIIVLVLAVFEGFQNEVQTSLWNSGNHITVYREPSGKPLKDSAEIIERLRGLDKKKQNFRAIYPAISVNGLMENNGRFEGKFLRAVPVEVDTKGKGQLKNYPEIVHYNADLMKNFDGGNYILMGREMARAMGWKLGQKITLYLPRGGILTRNLQIERIKFTIAGFFRTGYYEFDVNLFYISLATAQRVLDMKNLAGEIIVQLQDLSQLRTSKEGFLVELNQIKQNGFKVQTLEDTRGDFLAALQLEKFSMIVIMALLIMAGIAGIWVTVHLLVQSKTQSIGMLRAMGMPIWSIVFIFTTHSMLIGFFATLIGGSLGIYVAQRLERFIELVEDFINGVFGALIHNWIPLELIPKNIYYFDHLPVSTNIVLIFGITLATVILSGLVGYFPARRMARMDPVKTLRAE